MGFLSSLKNLGASAWHGATSAASSAANVASSAGHAVANTASSMYNGASHLADTASGYVNRAENAVTSGAHWVEDKVDSGSHALAAHAKGIPVLGSLAKAAADGATFMAQVDGGIVGGATSLVGGVANAALHPVATAKGLETMAEHVPGPLGQTMRLGHGLLDVAGGHASMGDVMDRSFNPAREMREDASYWKNVGSAFIDPYKQSIKEGRYGEVAGRGAFDIGSLLMGAGEVEGVAQAGRLGEVANTARVADGANAARVADTANAARVADVADAGRAAEAASGARAAEDAALGGRGPIPRTPDEWGTHTGEFSGRPFSPDEAGGPIRELNTNRIKIQENGINAVERHTSRFGADEPNQAMIDRLRQIQEGSTEATAADKNFYAHELRESVRYRKLGWKSGVPEDPDAATRLWNNAHTATLEDYQLKEGPGVLYHPSVMEE